MAEVRMILFSRLRAKLVFFFITIPLKWLSFFFFLNDPAPTEISPLPLHDALPISSCGRHRRRSRASARRVARLIPRLPPSRRGDGSGRHGSGAGPAQQPQRLQALEGPDQDRKSTRLNSSHLVISYAVFCLKKKKIT